MPQYVATRKLTLGGKTYERGEPLSLDKIHLPHGRLKQLVDQRRIEPDKVRVGGGGQKER